jgi:malate/lactate dehydrogenase
MDIEQAVCEFSETTVSVGDFDALRNCDIILNTAGVPGKVGSRDVYLDGNMEILRDMAGKIKRWGRSPIFVSASNPVDVLNYKLFELTGGRRERFIGFSKNDSLRFKWSLAREIGTAPSQVDALVIGEHGDDQAPLFTTARRLDTGAAIVLTEMERQSVLQRVKTWFGKYQTLDCGRSSGWASGVGLCRLIRLIQSGSGEIMPCSVIPDGEYGLAGLSIGLPARLGPSGVTEIVEIEISGEEKQNLRKAADKILSSIEKC